MSRKTKIKFPPLPYDCLTCNRLQITVDSLKDENQWLKEEYKRSQKQLSVLTNSVQTLTDCLSSSYTTTDDNSSQSSIPSTSRTKLNTVVLPEPSQSERTEKERSRSSNSSSNTSSSSSSKYGHQCTVCGYFDRNNHMKRHYERNHVTFLGGFDKHHPKYPNSFYFRSCESLPKCPSAFRATKDELENVDNVNWHFLDFE